MQIGVRSIGIVGAVILLASVMHPAYADFGFLGAGWNLGSELKKIGQSFQETITFDPVERQKVVLTHIASWQAEKEELIKNNKAIPYELDGIISEKRNMLNQTSTPATSALEKLSDTIMIAKELGKIQSYVAEFHILKTSPLTYQEKMVRASALQADVNKLDVVKKHCSQISVNDLLESPEPFDRLKSNYCGILSTVPEDYVKATLMGN